MDNPDDVFVVGDDLHDGPAGGGLVHLRFDHGQTVEGCGVQPERFVQDAVEFQLALAASDRVGFLFVCLGVRYACDHQKAQSGGRQTGFQRCG